MMDSAALANADYPTSRDHAVSAGHCEPVQAQKSASVRFGEFNIAAHGLRGIASLLVLGAHIIGGTARHIYPHETAYVNWVEHPWYLGTFGVEIFFVLSGFVILPSAIKYRLGEFALRRLVRIYPLFFVLSVAFIALNALTKAYTDLNNIPTIINGLLFINLFTGTEQLTPNAWSLSFEVCFYVLTAVVVAFTLKRRSFVFGSLAMFAALLFLIYFPITIYFLIGVALRLAASSKKLATAQSRVVELICLGMLVWFASRAHFDYRTWDQLGNTVVPPILFSIGAYFYFALMQDSLTARLLDYPLFRYVGDVSYSLYLVHPFAYFALRLLFVRMGWFTSDVLTSMICFAGAVLAGSFLLTQIAHMLLERWPYDAVFHQRIYRSNSAGGG